jgi:hypothetical protein
LEPPAPKTLRIFLSKWPQFFQKCEEYNLVIPFNSADSSQPIHTEFNDAIMNHCQRHHLQLPESLTHTGQYVEGMFSSYLWKVIVPGNTPKEGTSKGQLLKDSGLVPYEFTSSKLRTLGTKLKHPLRDVSLIIVGMLYSPLSISLSQSLTVLQHRCTVLSQGPSQTHRHGSYTPALHCVS